MFLLFAVAMVMVLFVLGALIMLCAPLWILEPPHQHSE